MNKVRLVEVRIWGRLVGAVVPMPGRPGVFSFQYAPEFARSGIELSPLIMPLSPNKIYSFPSLSEETYHGLPGLLSDTIPDKFGNALIDAYLKQNQIGSINTLQRLLYMGKRATGALEFEPAIKDKKASSVAMPLEMAHLVEGARLALRGELTHAAQDIMDVGSSAGGARAKAVIGWNPATKEVVSGQFDIPEGFEHWLLKFDVERNERMLGGSAGYGRVEYAYHLMAVEAGLTMTPCALFEENGRAHFMTKRFDRDVNKKIHMHSLCGLAQLDFNMPYVHSYDQYFRSIMQMKLGADELEQAWMRCAFNVASVNCDDHTKNFSFLLAENGQWKLAPAYDVCFSHDPDLGKKTSKHQMMVNGKVSGITMEDIQTVASEYGIRDAKITLERIENAISGWPKFAKEAGMLKEDIERIGFFHNAHRLKKTVGFTSGLFQMKIDADLQAMIQINCQNGNLSVIETDKLIVVAKSGVIVGVNNKWMAVEESDRITLHAISDLSITSDNGKLNGTDLLAIGNLVSLFYRSGKVPAQARCIVSVEERRPGSDFQILPTEVER